MSRYYLNRKRTTQECLGLSIFWLERHGYLSNSKLGSVEWGNELNSEQKTISLESCIDAGSSYIRLLYSIQRTNIVVDYDYEIHLTTTSCHFGNFRYWFLCPVVSNEVVCHKRCGVLFLPPSRSYFGCRECYNLSYQSQNSRQGTFFGALQRQLKLMDQINQLEKGLKFTHRNGLPTKRYEQLVAKYNELERLSGIVAEQEDKQFRKLKLD